MVASERLQSTVLGLPFWALALLFSAVPIFAGISLSLYALPLGSEAEFVGLKHFRILLGDSLFWKALQNSILYVAAVSGSSICLATLLIYVSELSGAIFQRTLAWLSLLPLLISPFALAVLFLLLFHGEEGILNKWLLEPFGVGPLNWLRDPVLIMVSLILQGIWRWTGFCFLVTLAGVKAVPRELIEAARSEGASEGQVFSQVTLPLTRQARLYCLLYLAIDGLVLFSGFYVLLGASGGRGESGLMLVSLAYRKAFLEGDFGAACAVGVLTIPLLLGIVFASVRVLKGSK